MSHDKFQNPRTGTWGLYYPKGGIIGTVLFRQKPNWHVNLLYPYLCSYTSEPKYFLQSNVNIFSFFPNNRIQFQYISIYNYIFANSNFIKYNITEIYEYIYKSIIISNQSKIYSNVFHNSISNQIAPKSFSDTFHNII